MSEKILLIDGHSILNRAFYGLPDLTNTEGRHTGAVYGFLNIIFRILEEEKPDYLTVAFDVHAPTFRHKIYDAYKGTRKEMPQELREQVPLIQEMLKAMGVCMVTMEGYEADDLLGTLARRSEAKGMDVTILSGDRDLLQLATEKVLIRLPKTSKGKTTIEDFHAQQVLEKYQVTPVQIIDLKALMGDSSDNIPGIPGVGEKTAAKIIGEFGSVENAYAHLEEIKPNKARESLRENYDLAKLCKTLATINTDSPLEFSYEEAKRKDIFTKEAYELCKQLEFKNLLGRFDTDAVAEKSMEENFFVCRDFSGVEKIFEKAQKEEAAGISLMADKEQVYGAGIALSETEVYYIPVQGFVTGEYLTEKLEQLSCRTILCGMDIKAVLKHVSIEDGSHVFDAGVGAYLLNPLKSSYTYDDVAKEYLGGLLLPAREDLLGKASLKKAWEEEAEGLGTFACYEAYTARQCREPVLRQLLETGMNQVYEEIELPLVFTLDSMEKWGIRVKGEELKEYGDKLMVRIQELEQLIYQQAGEEFNINSPKQLGVILFEKMGIPGGKKTKTGYSTAADILEKLAPDHPIVKDILEYRQLAKLKSTYADGLSNVIEEDGRIHSTFNQTITATGRISSTEPNLQNIPVRMELGRLIRKVFVPEDGFVFLDADYSQIELRVLAHMSGDEKLIQAYKEAQDIHRLTASQVFHVPFEEVTSLQRRNAKAVNFGIVYGISSFGLSQDLSITRKEAAAYIEKYFETYPKIKSFLDSKVEEGKEKGYVETMFGRRRPVPELKSSNFMQRSFGERVAMNSPIQGTAADIIKIAMNRVYSRMKKEGLRSRLVLQVHDELLIETKKEEVAQVSKILEEEMTGAAHLAVELVVDMHEGSSWYEAK
ncbi:MAG TPA: DNA polymerase I [Candidatus Blautia faecavium]|uniref:DNA polymerase I n=1 Tax=Candidatus Blautia faecavium TaxID=2838487 RepID=A0A9D2LTE9_9FIRM|nr:DNA polymerase I [Candidatus Blautia faecavium]